MGYGLVVVGSVVRQLMRGKGVNLKENHGAAKTAALFFGISRVVLRGCLVGFGVVDGTAKVFFFFFFFFFCLFFCLFFVIFFFFFILFLFLIYSFIFFSF